MSVYKIDTLFASLRRLFSITLLPLSAMFSKCFFANVWKGVTPSRSSSSGVIKQISADRNFVVRRLATPKEIQKEFCERALMMGWRPGALDHVSFFAADPTGFYVGEVEGKAICCVSFVKYIPNFAIMGSYVVDNPYQGLGYGSRICKFAVKSSDLLGVFGGDAEEHVVQMYATAGARPHWEAKLHYLTASTAMKALEDFKPPQKIRIQRPNFDLFPAIVQYDSIVNGFSRQALLKEWIFAPNCHTSVALDNNGEVVGYSVVRSTLRKEEGWKIGPCYADNSLIARSLYQDMLTKVSASDHQAVIDVSVPYGQHFDEETLGIVKEVHGMEISKSSRVYIGGNPPAMSLKSMYATTSSTLG